MRIPQAPLQHAAAALAVDVRHASAVPALHGQGRRLRRRRDVRHAPGILPPWLPDRAGCDARGCH
eukprot:4420076-Alexandrium_andersonii.AAC.1